MSSRRCIDAELWLESTWDSYFSQVCATVKGRQRYRDAYVVEHTGEVAVVVPILSHHSSLTMGAAEMRGLQRCHGNVPTVAAKSVFVNGE